MNRRNLDLLRSMCSTFFLLAFLAGTSHAISFNFDRIQWEDTMGGTYADEDWGQVNVTMNSLDGSLFYPSASVDAPGFYGFLNIVTDTSSSGGR